MATLGSRFKQIRDKEGISQKEMASRLNKSQSYVAQIESGTQIVITSELLALLKKEFHTSADWLLFGEVPFIEPPASQYVGETGLGYSLREGSELKECRDRVRELEKEKVKLEAKLEGCHELVERLKR